MLPSGVVHRPHLKFGARLTSVLVLIAKHLDLKARWGDLILKNFLLFPIAKGSQIFPRVVPLQNPAIVPNQTTLSYLIGLILRPLDKY
jgi:hypothetical protein